MFDQLPERLTRGRLAQAGSLALHVAAGAALLALPAARVVRAPVPVQRALYLPLTTLAPPPPPRPRLAAPAPALRALTLPARTPPRTLLVDPPKIAAAERTPPVPAPPALEPPPVPVPPRRTVETGVFAVFAAAPALATRPRLAVETSVFAGAAPPALKGGLAVSTRVGAFDGTDALAVRTSPRGTVQTGGFGQAEVQAAAGRGPARIATGGFEAAAPQPAVRSAARPAFQSSTFGDAAVLQPAAMVRRAAPADDFSGVEILAKPRPVYSDEARRLKLEGEVLVEVLFTAAGEARVLRVLRGLGHGLDENALAAAAGIRFRPARRAGQPADAQSVVRIVFQLAY